MGMNVLTLATLRLFWAQHPNAEKPMREWLKLVRGREYGSFAEVKADFPSADWVQGFIIFNIGGNKYRLIVKPDFTMKRLYINFVGTHEQYDRWRPE